MSKTPEKTLRDRYFSNDIFKIGDIVEDTTSGEKMKILDRGSNYVTVASSAGIFKKWLNEITEEIVKIDEIINENKVSKEVLIDTDFEIMESGQLKIFGYETRNFNVELSEFLIEQFSEFTDLYSKHQIVKCLDFALHESDLSRAYDLLEKVDGFYSKQNLTSPLIVEIVKNDTERTRIAEILATVAGIKPDKNNAATVTNSVKALKDKYQTRRQWEVLMPFLILARDAGLTGAVQNLPYGVSSFTEEQQRDEIVLNVFEENLDLVVADLEYDDIAEAFEEEDFDTLTIEEGLSIETRNKLSIKLKQHAPQLEVRRERALNKSASSSVLMQRARRLAETMMKRRMFHKPATEMSRQEKERFESGAGKRRALIAKLAQRLLGKVRMLQTARLHHTDTPVSHTHDRATANIAGRGNGSS